MLRVAEQLTSQAPCPVRLSTTILGNESFAAAPDVGTVDRAVELQCLARSQLSKRRVALDLGMELWASEEMTREKDVMGVAEKETERRF